MHTMTSHTHTPCQDRDDNVHHEEHIPTRGALRGGVAQLVQQGGQVEPKLGVVQEWSWVSQGKGTHTLANGH